MSATWDALGLRATSSHDFALDGAFDPERRQIMFASGPSALPGPVCVATFGAPSAAVPMRRYGGGGARSASRSGGAHWPRTPTRAAKPGRLAIYSRNLPLLRGVGDALRVLCE